MTKLNEDGLVPGQPVDFATIQQVERSRKKQDEPQPRKPKPKPEA